MKLLVVSAVAGLFFSLAGSTPAKTLKSDPAAGQKIERSMPVSPQLTVTLCVASGKLTVRAWDKNELRVRSTNAGYVELRRIDKGKDPSAPAWRVDVMVGQSVTQINAKIDCQALADVDMDVPATATVQVQTRDGDINIAGVAAAYAGSQNGNIAIERASKVVEAGSVGGSISLRDSSGRVNLNSAGGIVEVTNVKPSAIDDTFEVGTVSGDIQLDRVSNPRVNAKTVNGNVTMTGPLARSGHYAFTNMTGDVILALPHDASFQLMAKVSERRDIISDFILKYLEVPAPPVSPAAPGVSPGVKPGTPGPAPMPQPKPGVAVGGPKKGEVSAGPKKTEAIGQKKTEAKGQTPPKPGIIMTPGPMERTVMVPHILRRVSAVCGSGDAMISVASFGGTVRLKKI
ncbi:MAG TPA: DUF4097 family beta strand repeat-containing protein [Pyrinomonadaceae bacterium]|nr:DUF4097 family beta strand repeat-containing protein [Pyrinomonadaceae bacterium]